MIFTRKLNIQNNSEEQKTISDTKTSCTAKARTKHFSGRQRWYRTGHHRGKLKRSRRKAKCRLVSSLKASIAKNQHDRNPVIIFFQVTWKSLTKKKAYGGSVL